jgi:flavodoxin
LIVHEVNLAKDPQVWAKECLDNQEAANLIHERAGGDIFEIVTVDPYPGTYDEVVEQAKREQESGFKPALKANHENIKSYDVIFIGYPNWWGTIPMPVAAFLSVLLHHIEVRQGSLNLRRREEKR